MVPTLLWHSLPESIHCFGDGAQLGLTGSVILASSNLAQQRFNEYSTRLGPVRKIVTAHAQTWAAANLAVCVVVRRGYPEGEAGGVRQKDCACTAWTIGSEFWGRLWSNQPVQFGPFRRGISRYSNCPIIDWTIELDSLPLEHPLLGTANA